MKKKIPCPKCGGPMQAESKTCIKCHTQANTKIDESILKELIANNYSMNGIARFFNISDVAVIQYIKRHNIKYTNKKTRGVRTFSIKEYVKEYYSNKTINMDDDYIKKLLSARNINNPTQEYIKFTRACIMLKRHMKQCGLSLKINQGELK